MTDRAMISGSRQTDRRVRSNAGVSPRPPTTPIGGDLAVREDPAAGSQCRDKLSGVQLEGPALHRVRAIGVSIATGIAVLPARLVVPGNGLVVGKDQHGEGFTSEHPCWPDHSIGLARRYQALTPK